MAKELRVRVTEAKQRDAGRGKARIDDKAMRSLNIVAGDVVSIMGKRETAAVAWPAYQEDQDRNIIRIDGLLRKNAGAHINEYVMIAKADVKEASQVTLAHVDMRLNVDKDFENFVKSRLLEFPLVEGDSIFVVILGSAVPFTVLKTEPKGIVKMVGATSLQVMGDPELSTRARARREKMVEQLRLNRFAWLKEVERKYASDFTKFNVPEVIESDNEEPVLNEAKKKAEETNQPVQTFLDLWTKRGKISSFTWSLVKPDGTIEYNYEKDLRFIKAPALSSAERNFSQAMNEITRLSDKLHIPTSVAWNAALIYRKALDEGLIRGRSIKSIVAAALYAACRLTKTPRSLKEIAEASTQRLKEISRCYRLLQRELDITIPIERALTKQTMRPEEDAFGQVIWAQYNGERSFEVVERNDGYIDTSLLGPKTYFSNYEEWSLHEQKAMKHVKGRVLDVGCGAGRHSLYLQEKGFDVLGIDVSPLAIKVCKFRGLKKAKVMLIEEVSFHANSFDTIIMMGNNFGLFGNFKKAKKLLKRFYEITSKDARIIADSNDPSKTSNPIHLKYHENNRNKGRMRGRVKIRIRFKQYVGRWFEYLLASKEEMEKILDGTGWIVNKYIDSGNSRYIAIIEKAS